MSANFWQKCASAGRLEWTQQLHTIRIKWTFIGDHNGPMSLSIFRVLIKCRQPAKKPATGRFEPSTFWGDRVKLESESLKLPTALSYQAAYFNILAVYLKN